MDDQNIESLAWKKKVRTDYDRSAFCYDARYRKIQWEKYGTMIDTTKKGRILDLGCGTGLLAEFMQEAIFGVDISFCMLKRNRTREVVLQADMDFLPFRNSVFDAVFSFTSFQNLPALDQVFSEVRRVLKKDHLFIFTILQKEFSPSLVDKAEQYFTINEKRSCGEDVGFICL